MKKYQKAVFALTEILLRNERVSDIDRLKKRIAELEKAND